MKFNTFKIKQKSITKFGLNTPYSNVGLQVIFLFCEPHHWEGVGIQNTMFIL